MNADGAREARRHLVRRFYASDRSVPENPSEFDALCGLIRGLGKKTYTHILRNWASVEAFACDEAAPEKISDARTLRAWSEVRSHALALGLLPRTESSQQKDARNGEVPRLLTAQQVSEGTGLARQRVYELTRLGLIPHVKVGASYRYAADQLQEWVQAGGTP